MAEAPQPIHIEEKDANFKSSGRGTIGSTRRHSSSSAVRLADRKSTRLNSSHVKISYAVFCLKKKKHRHTRLLLRRQRAAHPDPAAERVAAGADLFFFNDTAPTEIYTLSLHDALPIFFSGPIS